MACWKPFGQNRSEGMTSRKHGPAAEYTAQNTAMMTNFGRLNLEINFIRKLVLRIEVCFWSDILL